MYCIKCGVELSDSEERCPLCGTPVILPPDEKKTEPRLYPPYEKSVEKVNPAGVLFVVTVLFSMVIVISLLCDWKVNTHIIWAGYVTGALLLTYLIVMLPSWFQRPLLAVHIPCDFVGAALFLWYINWKTGGHWFLTLGLPVVAGICVIVSAVVVLLRYCRGGHLYIWSGAFLLSGVFMLILEWLINLTFSLRSGFIWSVYPLIAFVMIGIMLLVIALVRPLRESLAKKFFY